MDTLLRDLKLAIRSLSRAPGFTAVAALSLAAAIAANATVFALVDGLLLRPLPQVPEPGRLVRAYAYADGARSSSEYQPLSYPTYAELRGETGSLAGLAAVAINSFGIGDALGAGAVAGAATRAWGYVVSGNYFDVLGVRPALGRGFLAQEDHDPAAPPVLVISDGFWRRRFGGDPGIVGRAVLLNGHPVTVVGVAPPGFLGTETIFAADVWVPALSYAQARGPVVASSLLEDRGNRWLFGVGRLAAGATIERATAEMATVARRLGAAFPATDRGYSVRLYAEADARPEPGLPTRFFAAVLLGVAAIVLLVACANVANLVLARAAGRRREVAVRVALGAGRGRLVRQMLTESALLAALGGALGLLLALWASGFLRLLAPPADIPFVLVPPMSARVLLFATGVTALTVLAFGLAPALSATGSDVAVTIKGESVIGGGRGRSRSRAALVVAQLALSTVLLAAAGLFARSLRGAARVDPGFDLRAGLTVPLDLRFVRTDSLRGAAYFRRVVERVGALPGVGSAAIVSPMPLGWSSSDQEVYPQGFAPGADGRGVRVQMAVTGLGYFATMGIPVLDGRDFTRADADPGPGPEPVIVNQTLARRYWPGESPLGKRLRLDSLRGADAEVVGVAKDGKYRQLGEDPKQQLYRPFPRVWFPSVELVVRARGARGDWAPPLFDAVRRELAAIDPAVPLSGMVTIDQHLGRAMLPPRAGAAIVGAVAMLALVLAAVGLYGLLAYLVAQRTREIGVRIALGARTTDVLRLTVAQGMRLTMLGLGAGVLLALVATRALAGVLYGVSASDPLTFGLVAALLAAVALVACGVPAWRAARVDPVAALRSE